MQNICLTSLNNSTYFKQEIITNDPLECNENSTMTWKQGLIF